MNGVVSPRIVSLLASGTEMVFALGLGQHVVGVSHECDFPPEVHGLPRLTRSTVSSGSSRGIDEAVHARLAEGRPLYELSVEPLIQLAPDFIITQSQCDVCAVRWADVVELVRREPGLAKTTVIDLNPQSLQDVLGDVQRLAAALHVAQRGSDLVTQWQARLAAVQKAVEQVADDRRPRVVCLEWLEPLMTGGNWLPELVQLAGGSPQLAEAGRPSPYASWDAVRECDPDLLLLMPCGFDAARTLVEAEALRELPGWHQLTACRQGRVFALDANAYFTRSGPRLVESVEILAHLFYPQRIAGPLLPAGPPAWLWMPTTDLPA